jgi:4-hydroxy-tetrahydrodipicolinate synthase
MWQGVMPAVTTKFREDGTLDFAEMRRCFRMLMEAGCDGLIACGSLGEGPMLSHAERIDVLKLAKETAGAKPALLTVCEAATRDACALAESAAQAGADGLMVVPSPIYRTDRRETVAALRAVAAAADLPLMIYSNRVA